MCVCVCVCVYMKKERQFGKLKTKNSFIMKFYFAKTKRQGGEKGVAFYYFHFRYPEFIIFILDTWNWLNFELYNVGYFDWLVNWLILRHVNASSDISSVRELHSLYIHIYTLQVQRF